MWVWVAREILSFVHGGVPSESLCVLPCSMRKVVCSSVVLRTQRRGLHSCPNLVVLGWFPRMNTLRTPGDILITKKGGYHRCSKLSLLERFPKMGTLRTPGDILIASSRAKNKRIGHFLRRTRAFDFLRI